MAAFAERARRQLAATGRESCKRDRRDETVVLTAQEAYIARLARDGHDTNAGDLRPAVPVRAQRSNGTCARSTPSSASPPPAASCAPRWTTSGRTVLRPKPSWWPGPGTEAAAEDLTSPRSSPCSSPAGTAWSLWAARRPPRVMGCVSCCIWWPRTAAVVLGGGEVGRDLRLQRHGATAPWSRRTRARAAARDDGSPVPAKRAQSVRMLAASACWSGLRVTWRPVSGKCLEQTLKPSRLASPGPDRFPRAPAALSLNW